MKPHNDSTVVLVETINSLTKKIEALEAAFVGPTGGFYWLSEFAKLEHVEEALRKKQEKDPNRRS